MSVAVDYIVNEVVCVLTNNFAKIPKSDIVSVFSEFYTEDEITEAKKVLMDLADKLVTPKAEELKKIKPRIGDGKLRRDVDDILTTFSILDNRKAVLPRILAADTSRIPTFREIDIFKISANVTALETKMIDLCTKMDAQTATLTALMQQTSGASNSSPAADVAAKITVLESKISDMCANMDAQTATLTALMQQASGASNSTPAVDIAAKVSEISAKIDTQAAAITSLTRHATDNNVPSLVSSGDRSMLTSSSPSSDDPPLSQANAWFTMMPGGRAVLSSAAAAAPVVRRPPGATEAARRKVIGTKTTDGTTGKLAASSTSASKTWTVYIGKLNKDTDEVGVREHLEDMGITVSEVRKLKPTQKWQEKSAAFCVMIAYECKDKIMSPDLWPDNVEVRDWFFKPK